MGEMSLLLLGTDGLPATQLKRLQSPGINYMQLAVPGGSFSCGACRYAAKDGFCNHAQVRAFVSLESGCCNEFFPARTPPLPPERWAVMSGPQLQSPDEEAGQGIIPAVEPSQRFP